MTNFIQRRRQSFLVEEAYVNTTAFFNTIGGPGYLESLAAPFASLQDRDRLAWAYADEVMNNLDAALHRR